MTALRAGTATDVGQVRQVNQDRVLATDVLWIVADGMGGHQAGEVAAEVAVAAIESHLAVHGPAALASAVVDANTAVIERADGSADMAGMGTTVTAMSLVAGAAGDGADDVLVVANVGDSRIYLLTAGTSQLHQISEDHSLVATLERQGQLTSAEAAVHPQRNIITRALGVDPVVLVDTWDLLPVTGDRYLMCSDGLTNEVGEDEMAAVLVEFDDPDQAAAELVRLANLGGGRDNITVAVVDVLDAPVSSAATGLIGAEASSRVLAMTGGVANEPAMPLDGSPGQRITNHTNADGAVPVDGMTAPAGATPPDDHTPGAGAIRNDPVRRSSLTWRVGAFVLALGVLVGGTFAAIAFAASNTYFVGTESGESTVVVFRGRPGGILWFDPTVVAETDLDVDDLPVLARRSVAEGHQESSLADALAYIEILRGQVTTTTTTTTVPTTVPTTAPTPAPPVVDPAVTVVPPPVPGG
jgi:PPM family protein phosphatase